MAKKPKKLDELFHDTLKDIYFAEKKLLTALPKMAKAASNEQLQAAFEEHLEQTKEHVARLERVLESHDETTRGPKCKAMEGLVEEGSELIEEESDPEVLDAGLIEAAQKVEHYEIASYGCARTYAQLIGDKEGARILQTTLNEEGATDKKLTELAMSTINVAAMA